MFENDNFKKQMRNSKYTGSSNKLVLKNKLRINKKQTLNRKFGSLRGKIKKIN